MEKLTDTEFDVFHGIDKPARHTDGGICIEQVRRLPDQDSGLSLCIVRLENHHVGTKPGQFPRRTPVRITNRNNGKWIIRYVMGNGGSVKGLDRRSIALDYDACYELSVKYRQPENITVTYAGHMDVVRWLWSFPDLNIKWSFRISVIGFWLGIVSLADLLTKYLPLK